MKSHTDYPFNIRPLAKDEGEGYLIEYPDLPGCMSDGETIEEALRMGADAFRSWIAVAEEDGMEIPEPNKFRQYSEQFSAVLPMSLHTELTKRAEEEGVTLNTLAVSLLAAGLSKNIP